MPGGGPPSREGGIEGGRDSTSGERLSAPPYRPREVAAHSHEGRTMFASIGPPAYLVTVGAVPGLGHVVGAALAIGAAVSMRVKAATSSSTDGNRNSIGNPMFAGERYTYGPTGGSPKAKPKGPRGKSFGGGGCPAGYHWDRRKRQCVPNRQRRSTRSVPAARSTRVRARTVSRGSSRPALRSRSYRYTRWRR